MQAITVMLHEHLMSVNKKSQILMIKYGNCNTCYETLYYMLFWWSIIIENSSFINNLSMIPINDQKQYSELIITGKKSLTEDFHFYFTNKRFFFFPFSYKIMLIHHLQTKAVKKRLLNQGSHATNIFLICLNTNRVIVSADSVNILQKYNLHVSFKTLFIQVACSRLCLKSSV